MVSKKGILYIVATPIGNLQDISPRALKLLAEAHWIAAEDTRTTQRLLDHFGIRGQLCSFHEHNERERVAQMIGYLEGGEHVALVSDAGTPLISDPGFNLVHAAHAADISVIPVPGPCAAIAALSAAGLSGKGFAFEGFLPPKSQARLNVLKTLNKEERVLIFYESTHRILESLQSLCEVFGDEHQGAIGKELTKMHETVKVGPLKELLAWLKEDEKRKKGEFVLLVAGHEGSMDSSEAQDGKHLLGLLLEEMPASRAVKLAVKITGLPKNTVYQWALEVGK